MKVSTDQQQRPRTFEFQRTFDFAEVEDSGPSKPITSQVTLARLAGKSSKIKSINLGEFKGKEFYPFVEPSTQLNTELRKIDELKSWEDKSQAVEVLKKSVLAKVFSDIDTDEAGARLANSTNFLRAFNSERDFDIPAYLLASYSEFSAKEFRKYEYVIEKFNDGSLLQDILNMKASNLDINRSLVNLTKHLLQSQESADYERMSQELDSAPSVYTDGKSRAAK